MYYLFSAWFEFLSWLALESWNESSPLHRDKRKKKKAVTFFCLLESGRYKCRKKHVICAYMMYTVTPCTATRPSQLSQKMKHIKGHQTPNLKIKSAERGSCRWFWNHEPQERLGGSKHFGFPLHIMMKKTWTIIKALVVSRESYFSEEIFFLLFYLSVYIVSSLYLHKTGCIYKRMWEKEVD